LIHFSANRHVVYACSGTGRAANGPTHQTGESDVRQRDDHDGDGDSDHAIQRWAAAVEWLCKAFGFEKHFVLPGDDGTIVHAQLTFGNGMIMLGSERESEFDTDQKPPSALGGTVSQSPYIIVEDADTHYARAVAAGAEIVMEIKDQDYGGRGYSCRDPEGHVWNFGSYDPWAAA
jgi:uncharacterized glyoxalase superfamily protein PhnB